jgi:hypothetical protein
MTKPIRILAKAALVAALLYLLLVWDDDGWRPIPSVRGRIDAKNDLAHGRFKDLGYGLPFGGADEYARLLKERYGIDFHYVDFCTVSKPTRDYADAYDEVSIAAAKRKFGRDVFKDAYDQAVKDWSQRGARESVN